jgi:hypothetical protein
VEGGDAVMCRYFEDGRAKADGNTGPGFDSMSPQRSSDGGGTIQAALHSVDAKNGTARERNFPNRVDTGVERLMGGGEVRVNATWCIIKRRAIQIQ